MASVGLTEAKAKERGYDVQVGKFPFSALGKARIVGKTEGDVIDVDAPGGVKSFEVVSVRGEIEDGAVAHYQVTLKAGFTLEEPD